jgi:hypothetical protein
MRETCQVRRGGCRNDDTSRHFWFATARLIFCDYRYFRKPLKLIVSTPTSPLPSDNHPSRRNKSFRRPHPSSLTTTTATPTPYAVLSKFRLYDWSKAPPPTLFAFNGLAGVCFVLGVYTLGDTSWWVVRRGAKALLHPKRLQECKTQCNRDRFPIGWRRGSVLNGNMVWKDNETRTAPTSIYGPDEFIGSWEGRWQRNEVAPVTGWGSEIWVLPGRTVESTHIKATAKC